MVNLKKQYKKPPSTFGNVKKIKNDLAHKQQEERKKRRTNDFEKNREKGSSNSSINAQEHGTKKKLLEWKAERERKKKAQESRKKKPPFIVGIVRHHYYSPVKTFKNPVTITKKTIAEGQTNSNHQKTITRATEKGLSSTIIAKQEFPTNDNINKQELFTPNNHKFQPPATVFKTPLFGEVYVKENNLINENNIVTRDNSTENALVSSINEFPTKDATTKNNIEMPTEKNKEHAVEYFKYLLYMERDRLQKHCEHWMKMQSRDNIKEDIRCRINQAVGQTTLLLKNKFSQFYRLIMIYEKGDTVFWPISCTDLHGFWDMMYLEVKDCDSRFAKLEKLRARHWREEQSFSANLPKKKMNVKRHAVSMRQSLLRASISDQKKKDVLKIRDDKEININTYNEFVTPFTSDKNKERIGKSINRKCCKNLRKVYTSTPFSADEDKSESNGLNMSASFVTMKISQLYDKSTIIHMDDDAMSCIPFEQTPRRNTLERLEKRNIRIKSTNDADNNNNHTLRKQFDLETDQKSPDSLDSSLSTVIEKTILDKNDTLKSEWTPQKTDSIETPVSGGIKDKKIS